MDKQEACKGGRIMEIRKDVLTPEIFIKLFTSVGWEPPGILQVERALENTLVTFTAYDGEEPVGMARLIGDRGMSFYIKDFAVVPGYQSKGIGKQIIDAIEDHIRSSIPKDWAVSLELISTKEAVEFYKRMGFEERPCEWDGPGMFKMIR